MMAGPLCTSSGARDFARRLLRDCSAQSKTTSGCGAECSKEHHHEGFNPDHSCSNYHDHSKERELYERSTPEKYRACTLLREEGKAAFKAEQFKVACRFYEKILVQLDYTFPEDDEWKAKFREMELSTNLNLALTRFRLNDYRKSIFHCNRVLSFDEFNVKAIVRRGLCHMSLCEYGDAERDFQKALEIDTECATARKHLRLLHSLRQKSHKSERTLYSAMIASCGGSSATTTGVAEDSALDA